MIGSGWSILGFILFVVLTAVFPLGITVFVNATVCKADLGGALISEKLTVVCEINDTTRAIAFEIWSRF